MQPEFWHEHWRTGRIGFHQPRASVYLTLHWQALGLQPSDRIFVPLCGKSLDLVWLHDQGHAVVGIELSDLALQAFCMENGIPARRRPAPNFQIYEAPRLTLFSGDFFALTGAELGPIAGVFDRAALVSWSGDLRDAYAARMAQLTPPGVQTLLVTLEFSQPPSPSAADGRPSGPPFGPPFSIPRAEVDRLYASCFVIEELSRHDILDTEPRMRARGVTAIDEVCYRLTRA